MAVAHNPISDAQVGLLRDTVVGLLRRAIPPDVIEPLPLERADFVALDFETANADFASICQIGIVRFCDGVVIDTYQTLVNPQDYFDGFNVSIHGIEEEDVQDAPTFPEAYVHVRKLLQYQVVVTHTHFDRTALRQVLEKYNLESFEIEWLDSARVARRVWSRFAKTGYGLANVAGFLNVSFKHHDALEDARAAGEVIIAAMHEADLTFSALEFVALRNLAKRHNLAKISQPGDPDGYLSGETIVFTGALLTVRHEAAALAARYGADVADNVTKHTTILVIGDQDIKRLAEGMTKSSKRRKAEALIATGQRLRVIRETDFVAMCGEYDTDQLAT